MKNLLFHMFIPHSGNNHRAKLLHNSTISVLLVCLLLLNFLGSFMKHSTPEVLGISYNISETELITMTNKVRQGNNLPPLVLDTRLSQAAALKANNMIANNYWAHFAPDGTTPWSFIKNSGYNYLYAGENLAKGFTNSQEVINAWMDSPTHKDNILSTKYNDIGFAILEGHLLGEDTVLIVQLFGATEAPSSSSKEIVDARVVAKPRPEPIIASRSSVVMQIQTKKNPLLPVKRTSSALGQINSVNKNPVIDSFVASKSLLFLVLPIMMITLLVDLIIVERKKIPRLVGHNLDHFMLISMFFLYLILQTNGVII